MIKPNRLLPAMFITLSLLVSIIFIYIASVRTLSNLENVLLQTFALAAGLIGSFLFGKQSANDAAKEIIKPHARSAFRRILSLYKSLSRVATTIDVSSKSLSTEELQMTLAKQEAVISELLATADDALEDWRDIVPEDVNELEKRLLTKHKTGGN